MSEIQIPEHVYVNEGIGLKFKVDHGTYELENMYTCIRERDKRLKDDETYTPYWNRCYGVDLDMTACRGEGEVPCTVRFAITEQKETTRMDGLIQTWYTCEGGFSIPVTIHYPIAYAITEKTGEDGRNLKLKLFDERDNLVVELEQVGGWAFRFRADRFALIRSQITEKKKSKGKEFDGGCLFCDKAEYVKENGIIYLQCTKYGGRVKEVEYEGTEYPEYCKRR